MTTNLKTDKRVPVVVVLAAMLVTSATTLSAADENTTTSTNLFRKSATNSIAPGRIGSSAVSADSQNFVTNRSFLATVASVLKEASASQNCDGASAGPMVTIVSSNAQTFSADACCGEMRTLRNDFTLRADALTKTSSDVSAHKDVRFFSGAVINVGRSSDSAEWRDGEPTTFNRFPANVSWAGGDAAARGEPRGLKLFSWSW
ncbi:MAG: hypothetical protein ABS95_02760 [Verrucomicrobia bacterium SCN 57-15]|nr:MAG: hypothetical protein ABS95_02760 [Verrucomicrobia bacterium SCN 57-15]